MKGTPIIDDDGRNKGEQTIVWALSPFHEPCQGAKGKTEICEDGISGLNRACVQMKDNFVFITNIPCIGSNDASYPHEENSSANTLFWDYKGQGYEGRQ
jgi:hypothetical protein